jgi:hypothetical protein
LENSEVFFEQTYSVTRLAGIEIFEQRETAFASASKTTMTSQLQESETEILSCVRFGREKSFVLRSADAEISFTLGDQVQIILLEAEVLKWKIEKDRSNEKLEARAINLSRIYLA